MSRLRSGLRLGCWATACIFAAPALRAADVFFAPRLTLAAGYDDNRFGAASALTNAAGSAFLHVSPTLDFHALADNGREWTLGAAAGRTDYLEPDFESRATADAYLEWWQTSVPLEGGLRLAGGFVHDAAVPEDDLLWLSAIPALRCTLPRPAWQLTAQAQANLYDYDESRTTSGEIRRDLAAEFRPGLRWVPSRDLAIWGEAVLEICDSNQDSARYQGAGFAAGADCWLTPRNRLSAGFQAGVRTFDAQVDETGADVERQDVPLSVQLRYTRRMAPWLDLFCGAVWQTTGSNQADQEIESTSVRIGATLAEDFRLFPRRFSGH